MLDEINNVEYWKKEYLELSKDNDKLEQKIQQYKQQIDELISYCYDGIFSQNESIELLSDKSNADIHIGKRSAYMEILSKLKERE